METGQHVLCCSLARLSHKGEAGAVAFTGAEIMPGELAGFGLCATEQ